MSSERVNQGVCVKPEFMYGHLCCKLRNSLSGYGGIRVVRVSEDLGGCSNRGWGSVVARSAVIHSRMVSQIHQGSYVFLMAVACTSLPPLWSV